MQINEVKTLKFYLKQLLFQNIKKQVELNQKKIQLQSSFSEKTINW